MRWLLTALVICSVALAAPTDAAPTAPAILSGGGTGTFDGVHPGSRFGFGVVFRGGSVRGHVSPAGSASLVVGTATFSWTGSLYMDNKTSQVAFTARVKAGGPGVGTLRLAVNDLSVGSLLLGADTVATGQITLH
jgi:hypothetical protein